MSNLRKEIQEAKVKKEFVASTIRMPQETYSFIEGLCEQLDKTKQDVMLMLIEEGIEVAKEELNLSENEKKINSNFHMLNTNKGNNLSDHKTMFNNGFASAFYSPWKFNIERIKENDIVFLYENGVGIIAYGKGTGNTLKKDHYNNKDEWYYQELNDFKKLKKPILAKEIKKILDRNVVFLRTMSGMPDGQKILHYIKEKGHASQSS